MLPGPKRGMAWCLLGCLQVMSSCDLVCKDLDSLKITEQLSEEGEDDADLHLCSPPSAGDCPAFHCSCSLGDIAL